MAGNFQHSVADIIRWAIITAGGGTFPAVPPGPWPVSATREPDKPDDVITVTGTGMTDDGRTMRDGERMGHFRFQVRVRSADDKVANVKASGICALLDALYHLRVSMPDGTPYCVQTVSVRGGILETTEPGSRRALRFINAISDIVRP